MFTDKFVTMHQIMEEYDKQLSKEFAGILVSNGWFNEYDGWIRLNYGLKSIGRHLTLMDDVGGIIDEFDGYAPINGGNVVYMVK